MWFRYFIFFIVLLVATLGQSQEASTAFWEKWEIQPVLGVQTWATYTSNHQVFNATTGQYEAVANRLNLHLRRTRFGINAQLSDDLQLKIVGAADNVGRDLLAGTIGGVNNGSFPSLGLWDAYLEWRLIPKQESLYLVGGYMRQPFSRESLTGALRTSSIEKSMSQYYIRQHLVGTGPGRSMGVMAAGQFAFPNLGLTYEAGVFNSYVATSSGHSTGNQYAPLFVGRMVLNVGEPEHSSYRFGYKANYFGKRNGLSVGLSGAHQGATMLFRNNWAWNIDLLWNKGPWHLEGEWAWLARRTRGELNGTEVYDSETGFIRLGYNIPVRGGSRWLEPTVMMMRFQGGRSQPAQALAEQLDSFAGHDITYDIGLNYHLVPNHLTLQLHYTHRQGDAGSAAAGEELNQYFFQRGVGAIQRGNWWGLGLVFVY